MAIEFPRDSEYLAPGRHSANADEIKEALVDAFPASTRRGPLFDRWGTMLTAMDRVIQVEGQWIDGSFVSKKLEPGDVDLVSFFDGETLDALDEPSKALLAGLVAGKLSKEIHACDSFIVAVYPVGHPLRPLYEAALRAWDNLFGSDRAGTAKGYLELDRA